MKIICAPDSFKESIQAADAAAAMAKGVRDSCPGADIDQCPIGDGGEGTLAALLGSVPGEIVWVTAADVFGVPVKSGFGLFDAGKEVYIESASVLGLSLLPSRQRNVMRSTSFGVGEIINGACQAEPARIVVGVGGSATNDGGCGMAQALGVRFFDRRGVLIDEPITGATMRDVNHIDVSERIDILNTVAIEAACDVNSPYFGPMGAAMVYAPQKGANLEEAMQLDDGLRHLAEVIQRDLGIDIASRPGAGAGGGLGGGLMAFANASGVSGIEKVLEAVGFERRSQGADLCLTGEGKLDSQSTSGKACAGVARAAASFEIPVIALVGQAGTDAKEMLTQGKMPGLTDFVVISDGISKAEAIERVAELLRVAAASVVDRYLTLF